MTRARRAEAGKAALLALVLPLLVIAEGLDAGAALRLSLAHVGGLALAGACVVTIFGIALPRSWADRLAVAWLAGWGAIPLFVLAAYASGALGWSVAVTLAALVGAALWARARRGPAEAEREVPASIPLGVYALALGYTAISVAVPFSHFSPAFMTRELYFDGVQRFGTAYALAASVPPANPFVAGAPLHYYWFFLVPHAAEYRLVHADLFAVWKCAQTWTAMLLLPGAWSLLQAAFRSCAVAWAGLVFGFVFASWEILASRELARALAGLADDGWGGLARRLLTEAFTSDPDMRLGLITAYSDQLFMEDFVYVPQNVAALSVTLLALRYQQAARTGLATLTLSSLAGFNSFFALPAYAAFLVAQAMLAGPRAAALAATALAAWSLVWLRVCEILAVPLPATLAAAALATAALRLGGPRPASEDDGAASRRWLRAAAGACLVSLALVVTRQPSWNLAALVLNYGPGFVLAVALMVRVVRRGTTAPPAAAVVFVLVAATVSALTTWFLALQFVESAPALVRRAAGAAGLEVNLFNFHHKTWKLSRLGWALLAGVLLHETSGRWRARLAARPALRLATAIALTLALLASLVRPFTYLGGGAVSEGAAADYLRRHGRGLATRVLLEDFREARLPMLVPVSTHYFASWSGGNPGLTHQVGTWADQYLPPRARAESPRREAHQQRFFAPDASTAARARILREERIDYVLTRTPRDLEPLATLVAGEPGGHLYRVRVGPGG